MPQSTPERKAKWKSDDVACDFLESKGYRLIKTGKFKWCWQPPNPYPSNEELDAMIYLQEEWDFGGFIA